MHLQFEATGHYQIQILNENGIRNTVEFNNLITDIGLTDWLTHGIGDQLKVAIGKDAGTPDKTMTTLPTTITNVGLTTVNTDGIVTETDTHFIYRYIYERLCPAETTDITYNALATVFPGTNNLFSIAKIRNMDNELIDLEVKSTEQVKIVYELRLTIAKNLYTRDNTDIGYAGLSDVSIRAEVGSNIKTGLSSFVTTLRDTEQTDSDDGYEVSLEQLNTKLEQMEDRLRISLEEKLSYKQYEDDLLDIKTIDRDLGLFRLVTTLNPAINRKLTTMDITMNCSIDIFKGGE